MPASHSTTVREPEQASAARRERLTLLAMCFGLFMIMLDNTIVNVALPSIQRDLHASPETLAWTVNAYVVPFAALILLGGKLGDRFGRRRMFVVGLAIFTLASAACALSSTAGALVAARAVQGTGAALMNPLSLSILVATFPPKRLPAAIGVWAGISGLGLAVGPLLGGLLVEQVDWSAVFWINVPIGALAAAVTLAVVRESRDPSGRSLDLTGSGLVTLGLFCIVWGLLKSDSHGFGSGYVLAFLAAGLALLAAFVLWERRTPDPMLPLQFFARRLFSVSDVVMAVVSFAMFGAIFYCALYLQNIQGFSALQAGVRTLPWTLMILLVAPLAGRLSGRVGVRAPATAGMLLLALGLAGLAGLQADSPYSSIWPCFVLCGVGTALVMPTVSAAAMGAIAADKAGIASGVLNTARQVGGALGIAVLSAVAIARITSHWDAFVGGLAPALQVKGARLGDLVDGGQLQSIGRLAGPAAKEAAASAFMSGFHAAMWVAAVLVVVGAVVAVAGLGRSRALGKPHGVHRRAALSGHSGEAAQLLGQQVREAPQRARRAHADVEPERVVRREEVRRAHVPDRGDDADARGDAERQHDRQ
jgi:EmrB/QacA subfamily drug resistance transporter